MEKIKLEELQLKVMKALWKLEKGSAKQIQELLRPDKDFAITTIKTVLQRLYKKGIVDYVKEGRQFIYQALISEKDVQSSMAHSLIDQLFSGKSSFLVNHLIEENTFEADELEKLKNMIEEAQKKQGWNFI